MATTTVVSSTLQINYKVGQTTSGADQVNNQKFSRIKVTATNDDVFQVGTALGGLLSYPVTSILRLDDSLITN